MNKLDEDIKIETCATCKYLNFIRHGEQYCGQTRLPIDLQDSCELYSSHDEIIPPKKSNSISRYAFIISILFIAILFFKFKSVIQIADRENQLNEGIRIANMSMKDVMFLREIKNEKSKNNITIHRVYFTPNIDLLKSYFEEHLKDSYTNVNDSLNLYDTIFVEDLVYYSRKNIDSTKLLYKAKGWSIKSYKFRIFERKE